MREQGWGRIVNFASSMGITGGKGFAAYNASKEAVRALTRTAAREWAPDGIVVNCIAPAAADHHGEAGKQSEGYRIFIENCPMGRQGDPETRHRPARLVPVLRRVPLPHRPHVHGRRRRVHVGMTQADRTALAEWFRLESVGLEEIGSPFYGELERRWPTTSRPVARRGRCSSRARVRPTGDALALRLLGGVHRMVLAGDAPELARHYPSVGGDGDAAAAWWHLRDLLDAPAGGAARRADPPARRPTRSGARRRSCPGSSRSRPRPGCRCACSSSARARGSTCAPTGTGTSRTASGGVTPTRRCASSTSGPTPPLRSTRRRGDRDRVPVAIAIRSTRRNPSLRSRCSRTCGPTRPTGSNGSATRSTIAADFPVDIAPATIEEWLPEQLANPVAGRRHGRVPLRRLAVPPRVRPVTCCIATLDEAGSRATADAPLTYLRLEPAPDTYFPAELRLTIWPGAASAHRRPAPRDERVPLRARHLARRDLEQTRRAARPRAGSRRRSPRLRSRAR